MVADSTLLLTAKEMVSLTDFQNRTRQHLDRARRSPVTITKHGRPDLTIADAIYFECIERIAAEMSAEHAAIFEAARPTADELAVDRWTDDAAV